jgi:macrolide-specific efflux system membrane fusion protein
MRVRRLIPARRPSLVVNGVLGLAVLAAAAWGYLSFSQPPPSATAGARSIPVIRATVTASASAAGSVSSAVTATPSFATAGVVNEIDVKVGDPVKKGAVLAKVDDTVARRQLAAARSNLSAARDALDRAAAAGGSTSSAQAQVTQAESDLATAQEAVDGTVLTSPIAGTVVAVNGTVGSSSGAGSSGSSGNGSSGNGSSGSSGNGSSGSGSSGSGSSGNGPAGGGSTAGGSSSSAGSAAGFVRIEDLTRLQATTAFAEADATRLKPGLAATISWNALPGTTVAAKVASIDPSATSTNGVVTYGVVLTLDQVPEGARAGQTVQARVTVGAIQDVVAVNAAAVSGTGNRHTVTVLQDGRQVVRQVQVGLQGDQLYEIRSGLDVGDQVVLPTGGTGTTGTTGGGRNFPGGGGLPGGGGFTGGGRGRG